MKGQVNCIKIKIKERNSNLFIEYYIVNAVTFSDPQISKQDKDWLYPQMIRAIKKIKDSLILVFSPTKLSELVNYG